TRDATRTDNATPPKVNRTYQQVVTRTYARSTRQGSGNLTIPTNGRLRTASVDGEPLVIPWSEECDSEGTVRDRCKSAV
ncbi:conjugal transfer protein TraN, partial [Klebsiella pneumoniae]|nr:conjugal transfer protein TraN [Klebsiella pneumoniae]